MGMPSIDLNIAAIFVATIVAFVIGGLWYSPILFGNAWMKHQGYTQKDKEKTKKKENPLGFSPDVLYDVVDDAKCQCLFRTQVPVALVLLHTIKFIGL